MKKVLALVLAVMMMATVAFAASIGDPAAPNSITGNGVEPGDKITIYPGAFQKDGVKLSSRLEAGDFSSDNFTITTKRFDKGATLVKSVEFDDDDNVIVVKLNDNFDLKRVEETTNLVIKEIKISAKRTIDNGDMGKVSKNSKWTCDKDTIDDETETLEYRVGYAPVKVVIEDDFTVVVDSGYGVGDPDEPVAYGIDYSATTSHMVKFIKNPAGGPSYGTANLEFGDVAYASGRVYKDDVVFLKFNEDVNIDLVKKYPDADLSFVNFKGAPTFNSNFELEIYADEDTYIYEVKDNKIAPCSLKWDEDSYAFTGKVRTLGAYVISDTKLAIDTTVADGNPDTGANDVVGIATALAAVALVSAAAVSLKK